MMTSYNSMITNYDSFIGLSLFNLITYSLRLTRIGKSHFKLYMEMLRLTKLGRQAKNPKGFQPMIYKRMNHHSSSLDIPTYSD